MYIQIITRIPYFINIKDLSLHKRVSRDMHARGVVDVKIKIIEQDFMYTVHHKVHIFTEYHSVCPLVRIGTLPSPLSPASVPLPPEPKGRHTHLRVRSWGSPNSDDWRKA
jgi:hypothetical protein